MSPVAALLLLGAFVVVVGAILLLAPSEDEMTPYIDQVGQRIGTVLGTGALQ